MEREDFGKPITNYIFPDKLVEGLITGAATEKDKFNRIYKYVTDKIIWNGQEDYTTSKTLKKLISDGKGNSADLNLLLISLEFRLHGFLECNSFCCNDMVKRTALHAWKDCLVNCSRMDRF